MKKKLLVCAVVAFTALGVACGPAAAEDFYKGKQITMTVGFNTGGAYDLYARLFAHHLSQHIAGTPTIIVRNMQGAGSVIAANYLYNRAAKDGTEIALLAGTAALEPLFGAIPTQFDGRKFAWLGSANKEVGACFVRGASPVKTAEDFMKGPVVVGTAGTSSQLVPTILSRLLGANLKIVRGYKGTSPLMLAVDRGEVDGMCGMVWAAVESAHPDWLQNGSIRTVMQIGLERDEKLPSVPMITDFVKGDDQIQLLRLLIGWSIMGRPFVAPPGTSPERVDELRRAFEATVKDERFLAAAKQARLDVDPISHTQIMDFLNQSYASPKDIVEEANKFLTEAR